MSGSSIDDVRALFERERAGVLCTAHAGLAGWPYGSVVPYALAENGDPIVFLSGIAEHTRNLRADPRATLLVADSTASDEPQRGARHAMLVRATLPEGDAAEQTEARYFARFPEAAAMRSAHGFAAWVLECESIRWIAGFGSMGWIDRADWTGTADPLAAHADGIVAHLNDDHADALVTLAEHCARTAVTEAVAVALDRGGLRVRATDAHGASRSLRLPFPEVAEDPEAVRRIVIARLREARGRVG